MQSARAGARARAHARVIRKSFPNDRYSCPSAKNRKRLNQERPIRKIVIRATASRKREAGNAEQMSIGAVDFVTISALADKNMFPDNVVTSNVSPVDNE